MNARVAKASSDIQRSFLAKILRSIEQFYADVKTLSSKEDVFAPAPGQQSSAQPQFLLNEEIERIARDVTSQQRSMIGIGQALAAELQISEVDQECVAVRLLRGPQLFAVTNTKGKAGLSKAAAVVVSRFMQHQTLDLIEQSFGLADSKQEHQSAPAGFNRSGAGGIGPINVKSSTSSASPYSNANNNATATLARGNKVTQSSAGTASPTAQQMEMQSQSQQRQTGLRLTGIMNKSSINMRKEGVSGRQSPRGSKDFGAKTRSGGGYFGTNAKQMEGRHQT